MDTPEKLKKLISQSVKDLSSRKSVDGRFPDALSTSSMGGCPSCPRVYEEIIQGLEADVRKHIRIEHQLKLHIESIEDRVEELEKEALKFQTSPDELIELKDANEKLKINF